MNIFNEIKIEINKLSKFLYDYLPDQNALSIEFPKDPTHGDLSTNIAMVSCKDLKKSPIEIANNFKLELAKLPYIDSISIAGPGFVNLTLKTYIWYDLVNQIINLNTSYGDNNIGNNESINIEFVSCNPTGPMHIGHCRGGIYGDTLANLMKKCGYKVTKEFYINDVGAQISTLADSAYLRYLEASGKNIGEIPEGLYPGDYLIPIGKKLFEFYGNELKSLDEIVRKEKTKEIAVSSMIELIKKDLESLGINHDIFFSEKQLHSQNKISEIVNNLIARNIVYKGILPPPKGKANEDWQMREQLLIRSTDFGDDVDRSLQKSNGEWTYAAADIAYMQNKIARGFNKITMVLGVDHLGYNKRMQAVAHALAGDKLDFQIKFCQLVNFLKNGQPLKMSKRKGNFISVQDVLDEVDKDLVRFMMLTRRNDQVIDFDLEKVKEQSKDNPVFYVQYANARINSILNNAFEQNPEFIKRINDKSYNLSFLNREEEIHLIKIIANWPKIVELSCLHQEPHRLAFYVIELASEFHSFWSKGNEDPTLRFIIADNFELSLARLMLAKSVKIVIASALKIFNVKPVEKM
ncbi:MAG: arginine--tRNA ligase [Pseudomonadota bacterium]